MEPRPELHDMDITLRAPCSGDIASRFALGIDFDIAEMFGIGRDAVQAITMDGASRWVEGLIAHPHAWIIETQGAMIGEIRLDRINWQDRRAFMAVAIYDPQWLGRGLGSRAILLLLEHAFSIMLLHRIGIRVLAYNRRAIRAYEKCGFVVEGRERETAFVNGVWHDDLMMGLLEHEFMSKHS